MCPYKMCMHLFICIFGCFLGRGGGMKVGGRGVAMLN